MLVSLKIENVAVIEKAQASFTAGLNVLTGETGAGKSILIDSISAILGNRTSRDLVRTGAQKACIWATFADLSDSLYAQLETLGYPVEDELLLYREISAEGKSNCRINGMPATATVLRDVSAGLLDIHGQHDSQSLTNPVRHLAILDAYAQNQTELQAYQALHKQLVLVKRQADALQMDEAEKQRRIELLQFQINEIEQANLRVGEEETLTARRNLVVHAQSILEQLSVAHSALAGSDDFGGAADMLGNAAGALESAARLDETLAPFKNQLAELYYSTRELATDLADRLDGYSFDPGELNELEARLDTIYRMRQKYGDTVEDVLQYLQTSCDELAGIVNAEETLAQLQQQKQQLYNDARTAADALTQTRLSAFKRMQTELADACSFLNMPGTRFALQHKVGALARSGQDTIEFYISTNPGETPKPLAKIASGGELSRIMLALKSAMADKDLIPTIIYDEIDTGVSGLAAGRIGEKLRQTAIGHQVICITHTAQIAAKADSHLLIQKNVDAGRTYTEIYPLDETKRVEELARIISGDHVTQVSLANAEEMLHAKA